MPRGRPAAGRTNREIWRAGCIGWGAVFMCPGADGRNQRTPDDDRYCGLCLLRRAEGRDVHAPRGRTLDVKERQLPPGDR